MTRFGLGLVHSPAGPGPRHLGSGLDQTWVRQVQDQTLDSLNTTTNGSTFMSCPHQCVKMAPPTAQKNAQKMVHTVVWSSDMPSMSAMTPQITTINNNWGLKTCLKPSCMLFPVLFIFFLY